MAFPTQHDLDLLASDAPADPGSECGTCACAAGSGLSAPFLPLDLKFGGAGGPESTPVTKNQAVHHWPGWEQERWLRTVGSSS